MLGCWFLGKCQRLEVILLNVGYMLDNLIREARYYRYRHATSPIFQREFFLQDAMITLLFLIYASFLGFIVAHFFFINDNWRVYLSSHLAFGFQLLAFGLGFWRMSYVPPRNSFTFPFLKFNVLENNKKK